MNERRMKMYMRKLNDEQAAKILNQMLDRDVVFYDKLTKQVKSQCSITEDRTGEQLLKKISEDWLYGVSEEFLQQREDIWEDILPLDWKHREQWQCVEFLPPDDWEIYSNIEEGSEPPKTRIFRELGLKIPEYLCPSVIERKLLKEGVKIPYDKLLWCIYTEEIGFPCENREQWVTERIRRNRWKF